MIFFITLFRYFTIVLFCTLHFFSFSQGMQTRERAHCARSVFPFIKKKKTLYKQIVIVKNTSTKESKRRRGEREREEGSLPGH